MWTMVFRAADGHHLHAMIAGDPREAVHNRDWLSKRMSCMRRFVLKTMWKTEKT